MGLILDSSILIADERGRFDMSAFLLHARPDPSAISAITASELLHGIERAQDAAIRLRRSTYVEGVFRLTTMLPFGLAGARVHARIRAQLETIGQLIGPHDLLIAATALAAGFELATLNVGEFSRVPGLSVIDAGAFRIELKR